MSKLYVVLFLFAVSSSWSQDGRKLLKGKVTADYPELDGIHVINDAAEYSVLTQKGGYFSIMAKEGDTLMFSAVQFKGRRVAISAVDLQAELMFVKLETLVNNLDEVKVIRYDNINAVALGIIPKGQKSYTPAERKLRTASSLAPGNGGTIGLDPLMNWISGRTAMLKKEVEVERKEILLKKISSMFEESYFVDQLNIPPDHVSGFCYYLIENPKLVAAVKAKNRTMSEFIMAELATLYIKTIAKE